jgi:DnaJ like chaperone protein
MGIFGTLLGGTVGFMLGGPVGAILGGAMGSSVSRSMEGVSVQQAGLRGADTIQQQQMVFAVALTSLAAKVAKADGQVTGDEICAFDGFLQNSMRMSPADRRFVAKVFNQARESTTPASEFARQLRVVFRGQEDRLRDVVSILLMVAFADGELHPAEEALLRSISRDMGLSESEYQSCKATFMASSGVSDIDPYEVLGVAPSASDADVQVAHRRLVRDYHPDVLESKGLPEDFKEFASKKMSAINDAWARVKKERGM